MDKIINWLQNNIHIAVAIPTIMNSLQFFTLLMQYAADGVIDGTEFQQLLMTAGSGINLAILLMVYVYLKAKKK